MHARSLLMLTALTVCGAAMAAEPPAAAKGDPTPSIVGGVAGATPSNDLASGRIVERGGTSIPSDEKAFLERLHRANLMEIQTSELARTRSSSQAVRTYADMMIKDHSAADEKIMAYARAQHLSLGIPAAMTDAERVLMEANDATGRKLEVLRDEAFDKAYLSSQLGMHDHTLAKVQLGVSTFTGQLGNLLKQWVPQLTQHRQRAYSLLGSASLRGVGGSGRGDTSR